MKHWKAGIMGTILTDNEEEDDEEWDILPVEEDPWEAKRHGILKSRMLVELLIGNVAVFSVIFILALIFIRDWRVLLGLGIGVCVACLMVIHMSVTIEQAMYLLPEEAERYVRKQSALRYSAIMIVMCVIGITGFCDIIAAMVGVMTLKVSAYIQPFTHKISKHFM